MHLPGSEYTSFLLSVTAGKVTASTYCGSLWNLYLKLCFLGTPFMRLSQPLIQHYSPTVSCTQTHMLDKWFFFNSYFFLLVFCFLLSRSALSRHFLLKLFIFRRTPYGQTVFFSVSTFSRSAFSFHTHFPFKLRILLKHVGFLSLP